jgi:RNA-directed DNA polymerase
VPLVARTAEQDKVRELQRTLYRAAKADPKRRFHALYDKVLRRDVLERAWELVRANRGAAGIDRQTIADVEQHGVAKLLDELTADLKDGSYRPLPARRVFIPKPGRPDEQRPLSIPTVISYCCVVQRAFGFVGGHASVPPARWAAACGAVCAS